MLQPKKTKYRKPFVLSHDKRKAHKGNKVSFGEFGLQAVTRRVDSRQIESARIAITRRMGREGQVFIRIFPHFKKLLNQLVFVWVQEKVPPGQMIYTS